VMPLRPYPSFRPDPFRPVNDHPVPRPAVIRGNLLCPSERCIIPQSP
jgi:hypothetical protein